MRKYLVGILAAYAATTTLLAVHWSAEAWIYRHCFDLLLQGKIGSGSPVHYASLRAISNDFGVILPRWVFWYLRVADSKFPDRSGRRAVRLRPDLPEVLHAAEKAGTR